MDETNEYIFLQWRKIAVQNQKTTFKCPGRCSLTFNMMGSVPIFRVQNLTLNQYLGYVNNNIDKNSIFGVQNLKKERIVQFGAIHYNSDPSINVVLRMLWILGQERSLDISGAPEMNNNIWGLHMIGLNILGPFWGQQRNGGMAYWKLGSTPWV